MAWRVNVPLAADDSVQVNVTNIWHTPTTFAASCVQNIASARRTASCNASSRSVGAPKSSRLAVTGVGICGVNTSGRCPSTWSIRARSSSPKRDVSDERGRCRSDSIVSTPTEFNAAATDSSIPSDRTGNETRSTVSCPRSVTTARRGCAWAIARAAPGVSAIAPRAKKPFSCKPSIARSSSARSPPNNRSHPVTSTRSESFPSICTTGEKAFAQTASDSSRSRSASGSSS